MLENGMIVGAWRDDPQEQPLQVCPICLEDVGELVQTSKGWMCEECADELVDANKAEFSAKFISENRDEYLQDLLEWPEKAERKQVLEAVFSFMEKTFPDDLNDFTAWWLDKNELELKELVREELRIRWN